MRITTERLALEPISLKYLESTYAYSSDLENTRLMMFLPYASIDELEEYLRGAVDQWKLDDPHHLELVIYRRGFQSLRLSVMMKEIG